MSICLTPATHLLYQHPGIRSERVPLVFAGKALLEAELGTVPLVAELGVVHLIISWRKYVLRNFEEILIIIIIIIIITSHYNYTTCCDRLLRYALLVNA